MRRSAVLTVLLCVLLAASLAAQERGNIGVYYLMEAKDGQQFEAGLKRHRDFHTTAGDKFVWITWQIETGPDTGAYLVGSGGHDWKDFEAQEALGERDAVDVALNLTPYTKSVSAAYWAYQPALSLGAEDGQPSKFLSITHFHLRPDKVGQFRDAITKVNEAIKKGDPQGPRRARWYVLVNGGDGPTYALVQERNSWADFAPTGRSLAEMVDAAFGKEEGDRIRAAFQASYTTNRSFIMRFRPDLSSPMGQ